jgi:hypothetical protein
MMRIATGLLVLLTCLYSVVKAESLVITFTSVVDFALPGSPFPFEVSEGDQISGVITLDLTALPDASTYDHGQTYYFYAPSQGGLSIVITSAGNSIEYNSASAGNSFSFPTEVYVIDSSIADDFYSGDSLLFQVQNSSSDGVIGIGFADLIAPFDFIFSSSLSEGIDSAYITEAELSFSFEDENSIYLGVGATLTAYSFSIIPEANAYSVLLGGCALVVGFAFRSYRDTKRGRLKSKAEIFPKDF